MPATVKTAIAVALRLLHLVHAKRDSVNTAFVSAKDTNTDSIDFSDN
jgi:hypothetical protein